MPNIADGQVNADPNITLPTRADEADAGERRDHPLDVVVVERLDDHLELGRAGRHVEEHPLVPDLDDVAAGLADRWW